MSRRRSCRPTLVPDGDRARTSRVADRRGWVRRSGTPAAAGRRLGDRTIRHAQARCLSRLACACRIALFPSPRAARGPTARRPRGSDCSPPMVKESAWIPVLRSASIRANPRLVASSRWRLPRPGIARDGRRADQRRVRTNIDPLSKDVPISNSQLPKNRCVERLGAGSWQLEVDVGFFSNLLGSFGVVKDHSQHVALA